MKKLFLILTIGVFAGFLSSCATVMRENSQSIPIKANVDKVDIKLVDKNGQTVFEGQTPTTVNLNPQKYTVIASKDGYKTQTSVIDWHVSGWYYVGNLALGGIIGYLVIDPITGDMYYLDEEVNLNMTPIKK